MTHGDIQYLADSQLIEKLCLIDFGIHKQAGLTDGFLSPIANSIMTWAKEHIDTSSGVSGIMSSLTDILIPGVLFKIHPVLGGLAVASEVLGFSPVSVIKKIIQLVHKKISSGTLPTLGEINEVGKSAVSQEAGSIEAQASKQNHSDDMFDILHDIEKRGQLVRFIRIADESAWNKVTRPDIPFFGGKGSVIERIFGQLFKAKARGKARWLLGGFIVWIIKTILLGAGLVAAGEKVTSLLSGKESVTSKEKSPIVSSPEKINTEGPVWAAEKKPVEEPVDLDAPTIKLTPTGRGQEIHQNDHKTSTWVVPIINGSLTDTLLAWAKDIYQELASQDYNFTSTESFNKTVEEMRKGLDSSKSNQLTVPSQFKSRKQVVDRFVVG